MRRLSCEPVNARIRVPASVDLAHMVTVAHLSRPGAALHPARAAMVASHAGRCGSRSPGIVMALHALWRRRPRHARAGPRRPRPAVGPRVSEALGPFRARAGPAIRVRVVAAHGSAHSGAAVVIATHDHALDFLPPRTETSA